MQKLNIQLYGRAATENFTEELSARTEIALNPAPSKIELSLAAPPNQELVELRLDVDDKPSAFFLHDLKVWSLDAMELYRWDGKADSLGALRDIQTWEINKRVVVKSISNDPFLLLPLDVPQSKGVVVEIWASQALLIQAAEGSEADETNLRAHQRELAQAVISLEHGLRFTLDGLAAEQEGIADALIIHQANATRENQSFSQHLKTLHDEASLSRKTGEVVDARLSELEESLKQLQLDAEKRELELLAHIANRLKRARNEILEETRDDWRSMSRQLGETADSVEREARSLASEIIENFGREFAKLTVSLNRLAEVQLVMREIRDELGVTRNEHAMTKVRQLKADLAAARDAHSNVWRRLMRAFGKPKEDRQE